MTQSLVVARGQHSRAAGILRARPRGGRGRLPTIDAHRPRAGSCHLSCCPGGIALMSVPPLVPFIPRWRGWPPPVCSAPAPRSIWGGATTLPPIRAPQPLPQWPSCPRSRPNGADAARDACQLVPQPLPPVGQSAPPPVAPADPGAHLVTLTTRLDGASVMPPTAQRRQRPCLDAVYDPATRLLRWKTRWSGLSGAYHRRAVPRPGRRRAERARRAGVAGARLAPREGRATLRPPSASDLLAGRW